MRHYFCAVEAGRSKADQLADATKAVLAILVILELSALAGARVLEVFGVSLDAFSVAGGLILTWMGFTMLRGKQADTDDPASTELGGRPSLSPLVLFAASPATITGVITLAVSHSRLGLPVTALVAVVVGCLVTWIILFVVVKVGTKGTGGLVRDTVRSFMGLIIVAMGVQFALNGLHGFFKVV